MAASNWRVSWSTCASWVWIWRRAWPASLPGLAWRRALSKRISLHLARRSSSRIWSADCECVIVCVSRAVTSRLPRGLGAWDGPAPPVEREWGEEEEESGWPESAGAGADVFLGFGVFRSIEVVGSCLMALGELAGGLAPAGVEIDDLDLFDDGAAGEKPLSDDLPDEDPDLSDREEEWMLLSEDAGDAPLVARAVEAGVGGPDPDDPDPDDMMGWRSVGRRTTLYRMTLRRRASRK